MEFKIQREGAIKFGILVLVGLILGYFIFTVTITKPAIGIIKVRGMVTSAQVQNIRDALFDATENRSIKAVVLEIDSPGGTAANIEEVYMEVLAFRKKKPIVASIAHLAASGAYYIAIATNEIYARPSSLVGGIGVISVLPRPEVADENVVITGPFKETGASRLHYARQVQLVQESFLEAVLFQRGIDLKLSKQELAKAKIYTGIEARQNGLIDEIGSLEDAIKKAACLAGLRRYKLVPLIKEAPRILIIVLSANESILNQSTNTIPINYYLYLEQQ